MRTYARAVISAHVLLVVCSTVSWSLVVNTNGHKGVVRTLSAKTMGKATLSFGTGINFGQSSDYVDGIVLGDGTLTEVTESRNGKIDTIRVREPARMLSSNIYLALGTVSFWDIAVCLPVYYDWSGISGVHDGGIGDLEISTKLTLPLPGRRIFNQGYFFAVSAPFGMKENGIFPRHPYYIEKNDDLALNPAETFYSSKNPTLKGLMLFTVDIGARVPKIPLQLHLNLGGVITMGSFSQRNTAIGALAIEYSPTEYLTMFADFHGESRWSNFSTVFNPTSDPIVASPGVRISTPAGLYLHLAGDFSLSSRSNSDRLNWAPASGRGDGYSYSTGVYPQVGVQFMVGWNGHLTVQDDDKDGIKNDDDRCPREAEDIDGFEDADGCPDPDNDGDGIPDLLDKCPNEPEDKDGFRDDDGCPDPDNDGDGIPDIKDQCPDVAEDFDGFEDRDGCPDPDNDKDGVPDSLDRCPNDAEDTDGFEDDDGCPDIDNDKDGIPDLKDKCPDQPETFNSVEDWDGCPDTIKKEPDFPKQQILKGLTFRSGSPEMTFDSYQYLEPMIRSLKQYPEVEIEVRGHTDAVGSYSKNLQLSQMRAESVRQYLISKSIQGDRIRAIGFGSSSPIADNKSAVGRAQNRRIEVIRVK